MKESKQVPLKLTPEEILEKQTQRGGYTRATLAAWGVPWPPTKGWKKALLEGKTVRRRSIRQTDIEDFIPNHDQEVRAYEAEDENPTAGSDRNAG